MVSLSLQLLAVYIRFLVPDSVGVTSMIPTPFSSRISLFGARDPELIHMTPQNFW